MSTVGLELTNFLNPSLSWKNVTKGYRSAFRRGRKSVAKTFIDGLDGFRKMDDASVSDTEKHGVSVLGHRFNDKVEHVPIKKRRLGTRSLSPQTPSLSEVPEAASSGKRRRITTATSNTAKPRPEGNDNQFDCSDDFSGIEILAAVACSNSFSSFIDDLSHVDKISRREELMAGVDSSNSIGPFKEADSSQKDAGHEEKSEVSSLQDSVLTVLQKSPSSDHSRAAEGSTSSREDKLPFDLNVAWEQTCDNLGIDSETNDMQSISIARSENLQTSDGTETQEEPKDVKLNPVDTVVSSDGLGDCHMPSNLEVPSVGMLGSIKDESKSEACSGLDADAVEFFPSTGKAQEPFTGDVDDPKASLQTVDMDVSPSDSACQEVSEEKRDVAECGPIIKQDIELCPSDVQVGKITSSESLHKDSFDVASVPVPMEGGSGEIDLSTLNKDGEFSGKPSCSHEDGKSPDKLNEDDSQPLESALLEPRVESQAVESDNHHCSTNPGDISSELCPVAGQSPAAEDVKREADELSAVNTAEVDSPVPAGSEAAGSEELLQKSSVDSTVSPSVACLVHGNGPSCTLVNNSTVDPSDDSYGSDIYEADKVAMVGAKNNLDIQTGYDSQFEDGELREPDSHYYWDENDEEDGEVEHVDYGSDFEEERLYDLDDEKEIRIDRRSSPLSDNMARKVEHCGSGNDSASPKTRTSDVTINRDSWMGLRASNNEMQSGPDEPDGMHRKDHVLGSRGRSFYNSYPRDQREASSRRFMGRDRSVFNMRGRSPLGRRFANPSSAYWESEGHYAPNYRTRASGPPRQRSIVESRGYVVGSEHADSEAAGYGGFDNRVRRQFVNSSNGAHERIIRRRSPANRNDAYGVHTRTLHVRDVSPNRSKFRRFGQGFGRGIREEHYRPMREDNTEYSSRMAHRVAGRYRSISPPIRGRPRYAVQCNRSRSRSRSRTPPTYLPPRGRNEGSRPRSRSPDFRSDARMERVRLPFQKRFAAEYVEGFISPARSRFSPERNSRWFAERNGAVENFRGRKSPTRIFRQGQRFDSTHFMRRLNSGDQFRPMMQSRKFADAGDAVRGGEHEGNDDDRRKYGSRYQMVHGVRRYHTDGVARRFRYNAEDSHRYNEEDSHRFNAEDSIVDKNSVNHDDSEKATDRRHREPLRRVSEE